MAPEQFFKRYGVSRVEELNHEELLLFAVECMDLFTRISVQFLLSGAFGVPIDPLPDETDAAIIEAYNTGCSFCVSYTMAEGVKWDDDTDLGTPGYQITIEDRSDMLKRLGQKDEFTTEMHWEMMEGEVDRQEFLAWAAYGAIKRGLPKAEALSKYKISEEFFEQVMNREEERREALPEEKGEKEEIHSPETYAKPYRSPDGELYPSYQAYCNDPYLDSDLIQCKLASGERKPQNDYERALLKDIKEARERGVYLEIYPE